MDVRPTWTDCDERGDYFVPNVLSPRELVSGPDNMDETVLHAYFRHTLRQLLAVNKGEYQSSHGALGHI